VLFIDDVRLRKYNEVYYVKYYLMRWDMVQDGWIKVEVLSIVIE
jgi:hypothetical protein